MTQFYKQVSNVFFRGQATSPVTVLCCIGPVQVDTHKFLAVPVLGNFVVFFQYAGEMLGMLFADILNTRIIEDSHKLDGLPRMLPEARSSSCFVVACLFQAYAEEVVGKLSRLF